MAFYQLGAIRIFQFGQLMGAPVKHAVFTRHGGISPAPWASLNLGATVGDESHRVVENRRRAFQALDLSPDSVHDLWQVHSTKVVYAGQPRGNEPHQQADILITDKPGVTLFMRFADCVPILLYDPIQHTVALIHAGWKGSIAKAASKAVHAMESAFQSKPADLIAGIGPSICADCYPVGDEVIRATENAFGEDAGRFLISKNGRTHLDLWDVNGFVLRSAGVERIEMSGLCTAMDTDDWYSHRAEKGCTGRFGALLSLE